jgi:hypothetical protein
MDRLAGSDSSEELTLRQHMRNQKETGQETGRALLRASEMGNYHVREEKNAV